MFPTGFGRPLVVSVNATADGLRRDRRHPDVLLNSATTVAAPTYGARTYGLDGRPCVLESVATSWAAAEVSGLLALLWQRYPDDTDEQIVARLVSTANGTPDGPDAAHRRRAWSSRSRRSPGRSPRIAPATSAGPWRPSATPPPRWHRTPEVDPLAGDPRRRGLVGADRRRCPRDRAAAAAGDRPSAYLMFGV